MKKYYQYLTIVNFLVFMGGMGLGKEFWGDGLGVGDIVGDVLGIYGFGGWRRWGANLLDFDVLYWYFDDIGDVMANEMYIY